MRQTIFDMDDLSSIFQNNLLFSWQMSDIEGQEESEENKLAKRLVGRIRHLEAQLEQEREENRSTLARIASIADGRGKFG